MTRKRRRYPDRHKAGASRVVPFREGETRRQRHARRLRVNIAARQTLSAWCRARGVCLAVKNDDHHWMFSRGNALVEWWPSSAKLVVDKEWRNAWHCHDWKQVEARLAIVFPVLAVVIEREAITPRRSVLSRVWRWFVQSKEPAP